MVCKPPWLLSMTAFSSDKADSSSDKFLPQAGGTEGWPGGPKPSEQLCAMGRLTWCLGGRTRGAFRATVHLSWTPPGAGHEKSAMLYAAQVHELQILSPTECLVFSFFSFLHFRWHVSSLDLRHGVPTCVSLFIPGFDLFTLVGRCHVTACLCVGKSKGFLGGLVWDLLYCRAKATSDCYTRLSTDVSSGIWSNHQFWALCKHYLLWRFWSQWTCPIHLLFGGSHVSPLRETGLQASISQA